ncbi:TM0106 family RecB-like putative nuclease [Aromatoleum petrolei]|uniref:TM0106 family RecB-like putative nuclease n=1 Tax=Aromatoleum petrolei TaxID=76116 RepID=A0ABX1MSW4_9RHOO|nr:TM0106 family RecB-like putative nuclease [Aromatoleum petrolei]NMF91054.1 TM0106 family RecB-like putative nuclease [Aromatoleum petrolei]QTQ38139.1 Putative RecB family protein [Aromatoleum petrolei]
MQKPAGEIVLSASDLSFFAECAHRTWLDRLHLDHPMEKAEDDEQALLIQGKGYEHEERFFATLKEGASSCVEIDSDWSLERKLEATRAAILDGAQVIYQATLKRGNLMGHADFLVRSGRGSGGQWLYEVADTKLARSTKAKFLLQLCFYSDLLSDITGELPLHMHVELGNGKRESFKVSDYFHYYRSLLGRLLDYLAPYPDGTEVPYPSPCDHCDLCPWRERCAAKRIDDDHLSAVAGITRQQIARLEAADIRTVAALGALPASPTFPKIAPETLGKLHEQARLQIIEREMGSQVVELLPIEAGAVRGFARLPRPDDGDLFFDMEGDPMEEGGLEYLFGLYYFDAGKPVFKAFWAHTREEERLAFTEFIDFVMARRRAHPDMHLYHYAHYENAAIKRLMTSHGVRESAVDRLLREGRLVDLYKVVREGVRVSKDSYSIKAIEAFYSEKRTSDVKKATDSIVVYEQWRESKDPALLESIRKYNEEDCRSTRQLRDWLLSLRPDELPWFEAAATTASKQPARAKSDKTQEHEKLLEEFHERLVAHPENPDLDPELAKLIDSLLDFYRRAAKPQWWALFDRREAELEELIEEPEVIGGLYDPEYVGEGERCGTYRYRYPEQDFKVRSGDRAVRLDNLKEALVWKIDEDENTVELEFRLGDGELEPPSSMSVSIGAPVDTTTMQRAVFAFAESLVQGGSRYKAVRDYLQRRTPDIRGLEPGQPIVGTDAAPLAAAISAVERLDSSYLFIQGPPGTGKTYTGSLLIASLLKAGKRVAVSSNSHKAINNLLEAVDKRMEESGCSYFGIKKISKEEQAVESRFIANFDSDKAILEANPAPQLVGGTAWTLARPGFRDTFDYLFIDEAGQVSLANTIAMGMCAKNLILLGDQMQLGQPIQGSHPGRSGESALEYLLDGESTISADRGIFLGVTYRMHPDVCRFISDAIYDSRLLSADSTLQQRLVLDGSAHPALRPTGICYFPIAHEACSQRSEEEAAAVREIVESLLRQRYRDGQSREHAFSLENILVVAPYNMQVNLLKRVLPNGARVGTVDKFQGQEAEVVIVSMATSSAEYLPRNLDFLFSKNRINVAVSRAKCLSVVLFSPKLLNLRCKSPGEMALVNTFAYLRGEN